MNSGGERGQEIDSRWAIAYDKLNRHVMSNNELGLANPPTTVDFEKMGQLGNSIAGFFGGLAEALAIFDIQLFAATFLILPYNNPSTTSGSTMGAIYYWLFGTESAKRIEGDFDDDKDILNGAFERVHELAPAPGTQTVGLAYLIRALKATLDKSHFDVDQAVSFLQTKVATANAATTWMDGYPRSDFVQRFVFLLRYNIAPSARDVLLQDKEQLMHLFGSSLSAVGVASEEVNNQLATELGMNLGIKAHQIGNALYGLSLSLASLIEKLNEQDQEHLREKIDELQERSNVLQRATSQFTERDSTNREVPWIWWHPILMSKIKLTAASHTIVWNVSGILPNTQSTQIRFHADYFGILIANLAENAQREYAKLNQAPPLVFRVSARHENGELVLLVGNNGPPIEEDIRMRLFRAPVQGTGNNGRGLWMLGLAFTNSGSPQPTVCNQSGFGPVFEFRFRAKRMIV